MRGEIGERFAVEKVEGRGGEKGICLFCIRGGRGERRRGEREREREKREERGGEEDGEEGREGRKRREREGRGRQGKEGRRPRVREKERKREEARERESQPLLDSVHCPLSSAPTAPGPSVLCPAMAEGGGPALLWSAEDMDPPADGDCTYVPTQLYPTQSTRCPQSLTPLASQRWRLMSATEHINATVGNIYIGNCVEPLEWAGEHVGYVIDASHGRSNVDVIVQTPFPRGRPPPCVPCHGPPFGWPCCFLSHFLWPCCPN